MWKPRLASLVLLVAAFPGAYLSRKYASSIDDGVGFFFFWAALAIATFFSFVGGLGGTVISFGTELNSKGYLKLRDNVLGETLPALTPGQNYCETSLKVGILLCFIGVILLGVGMCILGLGYLTWMYPSKAGILLALTGIIVGAGRLIAKGGTGRTFVLATIACAIAGSAFWGAQFVDWGPASTQVKQAFIHDVVPVILMIAGLIAAGVLFYYLKGTKVYAGFCPTAPPKERKV